MYIIVDFAHNTYGNITCKINDYFLNINMLVDIICIFNTLYSHLFNFVCSSTTCLILCLIHQMV